MKRTRVSIIAAVWALGLTQIIGYGTLYYSFSILAPDMARDVGVSTEWAFGALSITLAAGSLLAPTAGRLADRFGAGRLMTAGSAVAGLALALCAVAPDRRTFFAALLLMELASGFVLYSTAFVAIVQLEPPDPRRSITHLTLIAGFASTLFWPLTSILHDTLAWRGVYLVFAALNLGLCLPLHAWLAALSATAQPAHSPGDGGATHRNHPPGIDRRLRRPAFLLMLAGFAAEGLALSGILVHMVPLTAALGLGGAGIYVSALFGPAQVASRLVNMLAGGRLGQTYLAALSAGLLTSAIGVLLTTTPWLPGAIVFAVVFGLGSGLASIVGGTLPLELFGRDGYGARLGWVASARQITSAVAPFALSASMAWLGVATSLAIGAAVAAAGFVAFLSIAFLVRRQPRMQAAGDPAASRPAL